MAVIDKYSDLEFVKTHYDNLAQHYDSVFTYLNEKTSEIVIQWLSLTPDDRLADIGGGTGCVSESIWKSAGLNSPVLVVDPSEKEIEIAKHKQGVTALVGSVDDFLTFADVKSYNKYTICYAVHHFPDQQGVFKRMYNCLPSGGQVLIIQFPEKFPLPLWKAALAKRAKVEPLDNTVQYLQEAGFTVETGEEKCHRTVQKDKYFANLRHRVYTVLELFTTEEIEIGIEELSKTLKDSDLFEYDEIYAVVKATK